MTTATDDATKPASEQAGAPDEPSIIDVFYGPAPKAETDLPDQSPTSTPDSEKGSAAPSDQTAVASPGPEKTTEPPKGAEDEKAKAEKEKAEKDKDKDSHQAAARRLGNEVKDLKAQLEVKTEENKILQAKLDGTYKEPDKPSPEEERKLAEFRGREAASRQVAFEKYGEQTVREKIYEKGSAYEDLVGRKPWVQLRVLRSAQPAMEAMRVLEEQSFLEQYGEDPTQWEAKIIEAVKPKLLEEFKQSLKPPTGKEVPTVTDGRGDSGRHEPERSLTDIFYGSSKRS